MTQRASLIFTGAGYVYRWGDDFDPDMVTIEVSHLRYKGGSPLAMLATSTTLPGAVVIPDTDGKVMNGEVWLLGDRSRMEYAAGLTRLIRAPDEATPLNFVNMLSDLVQRVLENENRDEEPHLLNYAYERPQTTFLIDTIVPVGAPTILYGAGGVGKSIMAAAMAVAIQTGTRWLGLDVQQAEVLYLDWETDEDDVARRVMAAAAGMGVAPPPIRYVSLLKPIGDVVPGLARTVAEQRIGLVVLDSVGMALGQRGGGNDLSEGAIEFFRALRSLETTVIAIDHISGDDMRKGQSSKPYGSVYKWNIARNAYELRQRKEPDQYGSHLLLKHRKTNLSRLQQEIPLRLNWDLNIASFNRESTGPNMVMPVEEQVLDILTTGPATPSRIADLLTDDSQVVNEMDVRRVLKNLIGAGRAQAGADGGIRLATQAVDKVQSSLLPDET